MNDAGLRLMQPIDADSTFLGNLQPNKHAETIEKIKLPLEPVILKAI